MAEVVGRRAVHRGSASRSLPRHLQAGARRARRALASDVADAASASAVVAPVVAPVDQPALGRRLADLRRASNLSQMDVAVRMGTTQPTLARLESSETKPNLRTLSRYAAAIGHSIRVVIATRSALAGEVSGPGNTGQPGDHAVISATLASLRRDLGMTQSTVATRMGTTQSAIARLETGVSVPNLATLERYCAAMGVDISIKLEAMLAP